VCSDTAEWDTTGLEKQVVISLCTNVSTISHLNQKR
jgi:hypothetical protein